jgi:SET and MYND domain-containing protein
MAWNKYHKQECAIFGKLHPRELPTPARAVMRLLLQRKSKSVSDESFSQIMNLQAHLEHREKANPEAWEGICLMAKAVHAYSGTTESIETVLRILCILSVNSFTLTNPIFEPRGVIFHTLPAAINHSCSPNSFLRFDIPETQSPHAPSTTMSVYALEEIPKGSEITISYIDQTPPVSMRRQQLSSQFSFLCNCPLCQLGEDSITDRFLESTSLGDELTRAELVALEVLESCDSSSSAGQPYSEQIPNLKQALSTLSRTGRWPQYRYPYPQLQKHLNIQLIVSQNFEEGLLHACFTASAIDEKLHSSPNHPTRVVGQWTIFQLAKLAAVDIMEGLRVSSPQAWYSTIVAHSKDSPALMYPALMCITLDKLYRTVMPSHNILRENKGASSPEADSKLPPPYIGPETAPPQLPPSEYDLPSYGEATKQHLRLEFDEARTHQVFPGKFEQLVAKAMENLKTGDGAIFWRAYTEGLLPTREEVQYWLDKKVKGIFKKDGRGQKGLGAWV